MEGPGNFFKRMKKNAVYSDILENKAVKYNHAIKLAIEIASPASYSLNFLRPTQKWEEKSKEHEKPRSGLMMLATNEVTKVRGNSSRGRNGTR